MGTGNSEGDDRSLTRCLALNQGARLARALVKCQAPGFSV